MNGILSVCCLALLAGCAMDNDEIIAQTAKCSKAGMSTQTIINGLTLEVRRIQCVPKDSK